MVSKAGSGRFAFIDAGEAARRLGIDRLTLDQWVKDGRIRPYRNGPSVFFRVNDVEAIYKELHPDAELAQAVAADESENAGTAKPLGLVKRQQDPQMRVYLRLQADAKWYDISEADIRAWFQQLSPDGYDRNKRNAEHTIKKLQFLVNLLNEGQQRKEEKE